MPVFTGMTGERLKVVRTGGNMTRASFRAAVS